MARKKTSSNQMPLITDVLYDQRFLESHAGSQILHEPKTAIVELIANAWDAGATDVKIASPIVPRKFSTCLIRLTQLGLRIVWGAKPVKLSANPKRLLSRKYKFLSIF